MADDPDLQAFLEAARSSLAGAQGTVGTDLQLPSAMVLANAELELKAAILSDAQGHLTVKTFSSQDILRGSINPAMLSTVKVNFVATLGETLPSQSSPATGGPQRTPQDIVDLVKARPDIRLLGEILGDLEIKVNYVPEQKRWMVTAHDPRNRLVRELVLPDDISN
jgi:hypothetical protein